MKPATVTHGFSEWEVVALCSAVTDQPKPVRCHGADYVLFRDEAGALNALVDQCAHRRAPLSLGRVHPGGVIECPYHGWRYNGSGACVAIPNLVEGSRVPRNYRVAVPQVAERDGFIHLRAPEGAGALPDLPAWDAFVAEREVEQPVAYPADLLADVILEMPSAFLSIGGVRIVDDLPYGDPAEDEDCIGLEFAADLLGRRRTAKVQADFPLRLTLRGARHAQLIDIAVTGEDSVPLARARLAVTSSTPGLSIVHLRCTDGAHEGRKLAIGIRPHPDAQRIRAIKPYASILRRQRQRDDAVA